VRGVPLQAHEAAATLVQSATDGERAISKPYESTRERDCYCMRRKHQPDIRLAAWTILVLQFFERPMWTYRRDDWNEHDYYPDFGLPHMRDGIVLPLYLGMLLIIGWAIALEAGYEIVGMVGGVHDVPTTWKVPFTNLPVKDRRGRKIPFAMFFLSLLVWIISIVQVVTALICEAGDLSQRRPFWLAPTMTLFIVLVERSSSRRHSFMLRTIPTFVGLLVGLGIAISLFTTMGFLLFSNSSGLFFATFSDGLWNMFMILIGSNWPGPIIPAVQYSRAYFLFFMAFVCLVGWGFLNLIIGFIFSNLTTQRERSDKLSLLDYKLNMIQAFALLDSHADQVVSTQVVEKVLREIRLNHTGRLLIISACLSFYHYARKCCSPLGTQERVLSSSAAETQTGRGSSVAERFGRRLSSTHFGGKMALLAGGALAVEELHMLMTNLFRPAAFDAATGKPMPSDRAEAALDISAMEIDLNLFYEFPSRCFGKTAIKLIRYKRLEKLVAEETELIEETDGCVQLSYHNCLKHADTKWFDAIVDIILAMCSVLVLFYGAAVEVLYFMLVVMLLEFILRYLSKGQRRFADSYRNLIDTALTIVFFILLLIELLQVHELDPSNRSIRGLILFRLTLIARNLTLFPFIDKRRKKFRIALKYCGQGAEDIMYLLLIMFCLAVAFCEFGVLIFGGAIQKNGSRGEDIAKSAYGEKDYYTLNFNDFASGLGTLFTALHVNNVHITSSGFEAVMAAYRPRVFFASWHCIAVLLLLNVIPAFLLNNFWKYYIDARSEMKAEGQDEESNHKTAAKDEHPVAATTTTTTTTATTTTTTATAATILTAAVLAQDSEKQSFTETFERMTEATAGGGGGGGGGRGRGRSSSSSKEGIAQYNDYNGLVVSASPAREAGAGHGRERSGSGSGSAYGRGPLVAGTPGHTPTHTPTPGHSHSRVSESLSVPGSASASASGSVADDGSGPVPRFSLLTEWAVQTWREGEGEGGGEGDRGRPRAATTTNVELHTSSSTSDFDWSSPIHRRPSSDYVPPTMPGREEAVVVEDNTKINADNSADVVGARKMRAWDWFGWFSNAGSLNAKLIEPESEIKQSKFSNLHNNFSPLTCLLNMITLGDRVVNRSLLAAILVQHAKEGIRPILFSSRTASLCYIRRKKYSSVFKAISRILLVVTCFLRPHWTFSNGFDDWGDDDKYPKTAIFFDDRAGPIVCMFLLLTLLYGLGLEFLYSLEAEKMTESTQVALCVAAAEGGAVAEAAVPLPLTFDDGAAVVIAAPSGQGRCRSNAMLLSPPPPPHFKWYNLSGPRQSDASSTGGSAPHWPPHTHTGTHTDTHAGTHTGTLHTQTGPSVDTRSVCRETGLTARSMYSVDHLLFAKDTFFQQLRWYWAYALNAVKQQWFWRAVIALAVAIEVCFTIYAAATRTYNNPLFAVLCCVLWFDSYALRKFRMMLNITER
jgi:hypothetical protein